MTLLQNNAAGLNVGDTPTPANTGGASGDAFSSVVQGVNGTITVDNAQIVRGSRSYKYAVTANTGNAAVVQWDLAAGAATATARMDVLITAQSTSTPSYITFLNSAGAAIGRVRLTTGGLLNVVNAAGSGVGTGTVAVGGSAPFRLEATITPGTTITNGQLTVSLYQPEDSDVPADTVTVTTGNFGTTDVRSVQFGNGSNIGQASYAFWFTDLAFNDTGAAIGPVVTATPKVVDVAQTSSSSTTATSIVMSAPPGTGGLLVCFIFALTQIVFTPVDAGWQELDPGNPGNGWWKEDDGAASWTFNYPGGNRPGGAVLRIEGADPTNPIAAVGHTTASAVAPSVSPTESTCLVLAAWSKTRGDTQITIDPALTPLWRRGFTTTQQTTQHAGGFVVPGGTPTSAYTATADGGLGVFVDAFQVAIRPVAAGGGTVTGSASLSGSGSLTAAGTPVVSAPAALSGTGSLTASGAPSLSIAAGLTGSGVLSAVATPIVTLPVSLTGDGTLRTTSLVGLLAATGLSGEGLLTATSLVELLDVAGLSGAGLLTVLGEPLWADVATLVGDGVLSAMALPTVLGAGLLTGEGTLTIMGVRENLHVDSHPARLMVLNPKYAWDGTERRMVPAPHYSVTARRTMVNAPTKGFQRN